MGFFRKKYVTIMSFMLAVAALVLFFPTNKVVAYIGASKSSGQALQKEREVQASDNNIDNRSMEEIVDSSKPDAFTQSQAHLSLSKNRKLIQRDYGTNIAPYLNLISTILVNEAKYKDTHYAFYHTTQNEWRVAQDLYTQLYAHINTEKIEKDFTFMRFDENATVNMTAQDWLVKELKTKGLVDDNGSAGAILLSVNLALFGNVGYRGECSWEYFQKDKEHKLPRRETYENIMKKFGLSNNYVDEIMSLVETIDTKEDTIVQILVPIKLIDQIGYLAWVRGIPAHEDTIKLIIKKTGGSLDYQKKVKPTMIKLTERFAKEQENNPLYKDMMESVNAGDFSLDAYLKIYRNKPWELDHMNDVTGRLLFTPDVLLKKDSGVKFFRFSTASRKRLKEYYTRLNEIVDKLISEKEMSDVAAGK